METASAEAELQTTTVTVRCTGHIYDAVGRLRFEYTFDGETLADFLAAFFDEYPVEELVLASEASEEATSGWAEPPETLPGTWNRNPEGERVRRYARVTVNGRFNEHLDGFRTRLADGDRIGLLYPFVYCF
ncbi:MAG: MoaD/ThiS family protein [Halodesulfurarchaeum sp.]